MVNVVLHATNAAILFLVLLEMTARTWPSALVAALFAVHPLHVESVAWITERKDVLSGLFFLLTLAAYVGYARRPFSLLRYLLVAALFALGLMAKPMLVTLPFVLLLLDYWPLGRWEKGRKGERAMGGKAGHPRSGSGEKGSISLSPFPPCSLSLLLVEKIPLLLLSAGFGHRHVPGPRSAPVVSLASAPISARIARAAILYVTYLGKTLWPVNLAVMSPGGAVESTWRGAGGGGPAGIDHRRGRVGGVARGAVAGRRLVLVSGHAAARDQFGPGGCAGDGRPFPVFAADWNLRSPGLGCEGDGKSSCVGGRRRTGDGSADRAAPGSRPGTGATAEHCGPGRWPVPRKSARAQQPGRCSDGPGTVRRGRRPFSEGPEDQARLRQARYNLEVVLAERGSPDEIIRHLHKALEIKPDDAKARYNLWAGVGRARKSGRGRRAFPEGPGPGHRGQRRRPGRRHSGPNPSPSASRPGREQPMTPKNQLDKRCAP